MTDNTFIESIKISGFKSLKDINLSLGKSNLLIGSNGSGKSNILCFFRMLKFMHDYRLREFVEQQGGADDLLFGGIRTTDKLKAEIDIRTKYGPIEYEFALKKNPNDILSYDEEIYTFAKDGKKVKLHFYPGVFGSDFGTEIDRTQFVSDPTGKESVNLISQFLKNLIIYQFHDTSEKSNFKIRWDYQDNNFLLSDGGNLSAILFRLEQEDPKRYDLICRQIARVLPAFDRFIIIESYGKVLLRWKARGMEKTFGTHLTSDGSLRFFALVTLLNLPKDMLPNIILLDEPELGLHPKAVILIGNMINRISRKVQTLVATQSPLLVDQFDVDEITVLNLVEGCTECNKLKLEEYKDWLNDDFSIGDLWLKNVIGGRP
ncbi:MAG: AAA family ATPase [Paracoccaceae bacterium]|nr:AAA family ATPase [Paracoccaceae bacterium]MDE2916930.1 AAA family ATPase [Paracoccaceae bacterium]